jgi:UPF0755 protein
LGVTASKNSFTTALKHSAQASDLSYGNFYLPKHISGADALRLLLDKHSQAKITFTIPEGKTVFGTVDATVNSLSQSEVLQDVNPTDDTKLRSDIVQAIKMNRSLLPPVAEGSFEGWLFPATYEIDSYDPDKIAMQMIKKTIAVLQEKQVPESQWQTVITKASIVQKEVTKVDDMKKVAQVIENRLDSDMVLGMDTIVAYGINGGRESSGLELNQSDLDDPSNKYNARIHKGLPPTPISSPGEDAIDAVLNPEEGDWLYFCTVNPETGETEFSETEEEFEVSRNKYKTWLAQNPDYM